MAGNWTDDDKRKIFCVFTALAGSLKSYGNQDHKLRLRSWQMILESDMPADQVCAAMLAHAKVSEEIPTPSQLLAYAKPQARPITYAEYKHALEQHAAAGFPMFGYYGQIISDYENQDREHSGVQTYAAILENRQNHLISQNSECSEETPHQIPAISPTVTAERDESSSIRKYQEMDENERTAFLDQIRGYHPKLRDVMLRIVNAPQDVFTEKEKTE